MFEEFSLNHLRTPFFEEYSLIQGYWSLWELRRRRTATTTKAPQSWPRRRVSKPREPWSVGFRVYLGFRFRVQGVVFRGAETCRAEGLWRVKECREGCGLYFHAVHKLLYM